MNKSIMVLTMPVIKIMIDGLGTCDYNGLMCPVWFNFLMSYILYVLLGAFVMVILSVALKPLERIYE